MKSIQEQIEALTQELYKSDYPVNCHVIHCFNGYEVITLGIGAETFQYGIYQSTNKAEVEEYADCYRRLKLYQLLGKKSLMSGVLQHGDLYGTDFVACANNDPTGRIVGRWRICVLGGVWFAREEDRLNALKICGIDKAFQERCAKYGLGGA